jgi:hypothetical protein
MTMELYTPHWAYKDELGDLIGKRTIGTRIVESNTESTITFTNACNIVTDYLYFNVQLNHDRALKANISPHLHWFQDQNANPNWCIQYRWQIDGGVKATTWVNNITTGTVFPYTSGTIHQIAEFSDITPPAGSTLSDIVQIRLGRDTTNATGLVNADPYTGTASAIMFDIHYAVDGGGSRTEYQK